MSTTKIDSKLQQEIERLERAGTASQKLPVLIEHRGAGTGAKENLDAMDEQVRAAARPVMKRLSDLGIDNAQQMVLANAIAAELTPSQIRAIASESAVTRIIWNVAERVAL